MMDKITRIILLQKLRSQLLYEKYEELNLENLTPLLVEVENEMVTVTNEKERRNDK